MSISLVLLDPSPGNPKSESPLVHPRPSARRSSSNPILQILYRRTCNRSGPTTPAPPEGPAAEQAALPPRETTQPSVELRPEHPRCRPVRSPRFAECRPSVRPWFSSSIAARAWDSKADSTAPVPNWTASLRRLPSTARFQVIAYDRRAEIARRQRVCGRPRRRRLQSTIVAVDRLKAEGGTDHTTRSARHSRCGPM